MSMFSDLLTRAQAKQVADDTLLTTPESAPETIRRLESELHAAMTEIKTLRKLLGLLPS